MNSKPLPESVPAGPAAREGGVPAASLSVQAKALGLSGLARLFAGIGLGLTREQLAPLQNRIMAALSLLAARSGAETAEPGKAPSAQERAAASYRRSKAAPEGGNGGRARSLAILAGLFAAQGLEPDAEALAALSLDLEGGGGSGDSSGEAPGYGGGGEAGGDAADGGTSADQGGGAMRGRAGLSGAKAADAEEAAEIEAYRAAVRSFFTSAGDGPNDWQAFNERGRGLEPSWRLVPFAFAAGNVEFVGYFRILCREREKAVISCGADFRSNGHTYSFTLRGSELSLEGPLSARAAAEPIASLARALEGMGIRLSCTDPGAEGAWA